MSRYKNKTMKQYTRKKKPPEALIMNSNLIIAVVRPIIIGSKASRTNFLKCHRNVFLRVLPKGMSEFNFLS